MTYNFNDRASYIAYRAEWKEDYQAISKRIVELKIAIKNGQRKGLDTGTEQNQLRAEQELATYKLEELQGAKLEAAKQYQAEKDHAELERLDDVIRKCSEAIESGVYDYWHTEDLSRAQADRIELLERMRT